MYAMILSRNEDGFEVSPQFSQGLKFLFLECLDIKQHEYFRKITS